MPPEVKNKKKPEPKKAEKIIQAPFIKFATWKVFSVNDLDKIPKDLKRFIVIASDGMFQVGYTPMGTAIRKIDHFNFVNKETAEELAMGEGFDPCFPKMPMSIYWEAASFLQEVYDEHKSEGAQLILMDMKTNKYMLYTPMQEVESLRVEYSIVDDMKMKREEWPEDERENAVVLNELLEDFSIVGTIHSHAAAGAGHSATDDNDEKCMDGIHLTLGSFNSKVLSESFSFVYHGTRYKLEGEQVFEGWTDPFGSHPPTWMSKVSKKSSITKLSAGSSTAAGTTPGGDSTSPTTGKPNITEKNGSGLTKKTSGRGTKKDWLEGSKQQKKKRQGRKRKGKGNKR